MSRLFAALEAALRSATEPVEVATAKTKRAIYLARHGHVDKAKAEIDQLRSASSGAYGFGVAAANLVEGVVANYNCDLGLALDKLRRAEVLSQGPGFGWLKRITLAWQVHTRIRLLRPEGVADVIAAVLKDAEPSEHDVVSRICSIVAVALHWADRFEDAKGWYEAARLHAVAEGDELTIDANLHNVATSRIHNIRVKQIEGQSPAPEEVQRASWELDSSINFDVLQRGTTLLWSLPLLQARLKHVQGDFATASDLYRVWLSSDDETIPATQRVATQADLSLCLARTGFIEEALSLMAESLASLPPDADDDELAIVYFRDSEVKEIAGLSEAAIVQLERSRDRLARLRYLQRIFVKSIAGLSPPK